MWKHTSKEDPAGYNCQDSDALLRNVLGIKPDLEKNGLWKVFERHVVRLNQVLSYMSSKGVLRDEVMRQDAEVKLSALLDETEKQMDASVPQEARRLHPKNGFVKEPKETTGLVRAAFTVKRLRCGSCQMVGVTKAHIKAKKKGNPCEGKELVQFTEQVERWAKPLEFKVSKVGLEGYQKALKHQAIINRHENRVTFDESAIEALMKKYPHDKLYPLILKSREYQKLESTYIGITIDGVVRGGMPIGRDGKIHTTYSHNPSTLRLASQSPNLQNMPRGSNGLSSIVRNLIMASDDSILLERDYSGIEAVILGYFASSADYIRLSKLGIHSFLASHVLGRPADLSWSNETLKEYFKEIKKSKDQAIQDTYNACKRAIHGTGYGMMPRKMYMSEPDIFKSVKNAERLQSIYFELCPYIKKWQLATQMQAERDGYLRNPFSYIHRFTSVFSYRKEGKDWKRGPGEDANRVLAFLPQSTAAGIIKEAMLRLFFNRFEEAGQYMRMQVHDSLVLDTPIKIWESVDAVLKEEMERPVPELRLPHSYGMGDYLVIETEAKHGPRLGSME
jgi:DNA polymerase I-like protein with 3'-5' exonuclease and polymerase domains